MNTFEQLIHADLEKRNEKITELQQKQAKIRIQIKEEISKLDDKIGPGMKRLNELFQKIAISQSNYFIGFTGNNFKRILNNLDFIYENLPANLKENDGLKNSFKVLSHMQIVHRKLFFILSLEKDGIPTQPPCLFPISPKELII